MLVLLVVGQLVVLDQLVVVGQVVARHVVGRLVVLDQLVVHRQVVEWHVVGRLVVLVPDRLVLDRPVLDRLVKTGTQSTFNSFKSALHVLRSVIIKRQYNFWMEGKSHQTGPYTLLVRNMRLGLVKRPHKSHDYESYRVFGID